MLIACDIDGVVLDTLGGVKNELAKRNIDFNPDAVIDYGLYNEVYGCSRKDAISVLSSEELLSCLSPYEDVHEGINLLRSLADIIAYTVVPPACFDARFSDLRRLGFNNADMNIFTKTGKMSKPFLKGFDVLIEDNPDVVSLWLESGFSGIIIVREHGYNVGLFDGKENVFYCKDFFQIYEILKGMKENGILC